MRVFNVSSKRKTSLSKLDHTLSKRSSHGGETALFYTPELLRADKPDISPTIARNRLQSTSQAFVVAANMIFGLQTTLVLVAWVSCVAFASALVPPTLGVTTRPTIHGSDENRNDTNPWPWSRPLWPRKNSQVTLDGNIILSFRLEADTVEPATRQEAYNLHSDLEAVRRSVRTFSGDAVTEPLGHATQGSSGWAGWRKTSVVLSEGSTPTMQIPKDTVIRSLNFVLKLVADSVGAGYPGDVQLGMIGIQMRTSPGQTFRRVGKIEMEIG